jgi:alcohol dehydrogenase (cytochrome c)
MHWCEFLLAATLAAGGLDGQTAVDGSEVFKASCASCHGLDARGGEHGPNLTQLGAEEDLAAIVKAGVSAKGMPAFGETLKAEQIEAVVQYVRTLTPVTPVTPTTGKTTRFVDVTVNVKPVDLLASPVGANWVSYNGDYTGRRYSSLSRINPSNVSQLRAQWVFHAANSSLLECTPVVVDGTMFVTAANDVFALDAKTGKQRWHYHRPVTEGLIDDASAHHNRGVAVFSDHLFIETDNAHLVSLDARDGTQLWEATYATDNRNYGATSAPLIVKDMVIVGTSGGDDGVRGFVAAFDAATGAERWRFWTIPGPKEIGSESWPGDAYLRGGGTTWMPGTYDPELNAIYWGTGNPAPDFDGEPRPGADLYTDCVLALNADTGALLWYFQFTPHDLYDYDAVETPVIVDRAGRKLLVEANRNGFLYVLDRTDGHFVKATPFVNKINWASSIDGAGRPVRTGVQPSKEGTVVCPDMNGATNWFSPTYNPDTGLFYFIALESCHTYFLEPQTFAEGKEYYATGVKRVPGGEHDKKLVAYDALTATPRWSYALIGDGESWAGAMSTAGGLVFLGNDAQEFEAVDAKSGQSLWKFNVGQTLHASPMSYAVDGKQYVAIAAGSDLFTFALP